jgi:D-alanyl-lipoteichoic acid acyltransferase DltB (MBOAT superfamily)
MTVTASSFIYAIAVGIFFYMLRGKYRKALLAIASILFVFLLNRAAGVAVLVVSLLTWASGLIIHRLQLSGRKKSADLAAYISIVMAALSLAAFKYIPVYYGPLADESSIFRRIIMPVGYSFYIFQVISYLVDLKREMFPGEKNIVDLTLYLAYFPKFVSGPIERWEDFEKQLKKACTVKFMEPERLKKALYYTLFGCFMKLVVADRLGIYVDRLFEGTTQYSGIFLLAGAIMYTFQIYCDFAGYSYVARGVSYLYGIELMLNFDMPYCSSNITEFWRRWHISLSSWFLDYIYIPLGGNRKGKFRKVLNTLIVFIVCGMWHGAGFSFVTWGMLHGIYSALDLFAREKKMTVLRTGAIGRFITFVEAAFAWIFFRASSFGAALNYITSIVKNGFWCSDFAAEMDKLQLRPAELGVIIISLILTVALDKQAYKQQLNIPEIISNKTVGYRYIFLYLMVVAIFVFGIYGPALESRLIYMGF